MTTEDIVPHIFCDVDDRVKGAAKVPQASLYPSEVVTIGILLALKDVWAKPRADGSIAVGMFNLGDTRTQKIPMSWEALGLHDRRPCQITNLWGVHTRSFFAEIAPHDSLIIKLTPQN